MRRLALAVTLLTLVLGPAAGASAQAIGADALTCTLALTRTDPASVDAGRSAAERADRRLAPPPARGGAQAVAKRLSVFSALTPARCSRKIR
ncbi:MAG: hypothetical protein H0V81_09400 [Solirubrobacterales bacterium]|nr:hypothetical protein [Solirubrobacterales bacterium]